MNTTKKMVLVVALCLLAMTDAFAQKPNIYILATGGTIAGAGSSPTQTNYASGQVSIQTLLDAVPELHQIANVSGEQFVNIGSQDMNDVIWLRLLRRVNELLSRPDIDGVVITHGTDTQEETAYFLNLTVKSDKPVVLVGAMRPSTSLSPDGPMNLFQGVVVAATKQSAGQGVLVVMNGLILGARGAVKMNTIDLQAFQSPNTGPLGYVHNGKAYFNHRSLKKHTTQSVFDVSMLDSLPKIGILYGYADVDPDMATPLLEHGYKGIVHAGVGNGNIHDNIFPILIEARKRGILVVRASRVPTGPVTPDAEVDDSKYQFVASLELNPQKACILLSLALTQTSDWQQIQRYFYEY